MNRSEDFINLLDCSRLVESAVTYIKQKRGVLQVHTVPLSLSGSDSRAFDSSSWWTVHTYRKGHLRAILAQGLHHIEAWEANLTAHSPFDFTNVPSYGIVLASN